MKKALLLLILLSASVASQARIDSTAFFRHDVRIGWGDMLLEKILYGSHPTHIWPNPEKLPPGYRVTERTNVVLTGHFFAEYQYYFLHWLSFGGQLDIEGILWDKTTYDRYRNPVGATVRERNYNLILMPELRFTYYRSTYVRLYSGLGLGVNLAFDNMGGFVPAAAFNLNFFTVQAGKGNWYGAVELGMLNAMNKERLFLLGSRLVSVSVGYTFNSKR